MKPKRRWLTYSFRGLLIAAVVVAIPLAWASNEIQRARRIRAYIQLLEEESILFEESDQHVIPAIIRSVFPDDTRHLIQIDARPYRQQLPERLVSGLGDLTELETLLLPRSELKDSDLVHMRGLTKLIYLNLSENKIEGSGLQYLQHLPELERLDLQSNRIVGPGLESLCSLPNLQRLNLSYNPTTDEALATCAKGSDLVTLSVSGTQFGDLAMKELAGNKNLIELHANWTQVSDVGARHFESMEKLRTLGLQSAKISDDGVAAVFSRPDLVSLDLDSTNISDAGLQSLPANSKLRTLSLSRTRITDSGVSALTRCKCIGTLLLRGTDITDECLVDLQEMKSLTNLYIPRPQISAAALDRMKKRVPSVAILHQGSLSLSKYRRQSDSPVGLSDEIRLPGRDFVVVRMKSNFEQTFRVVKLNGEPRERFTDVFLIRKEGPITELRIFHRLPKVSDVTDWLLSVIESELQELGAKKLTGTLREDKKLGGDLDETEAERVNALLEIANHLQKAIDEGATSTDRNGSSNESGGELPPAVPANNSGQVPAVQRVQNSELEAAP